MGPQSPTRSANEKFFPDYTPTEPARSKHDPTPQLSNDGQSQASTSALPRFHRQLSPNELSYFLPSRAFGANDMMLCVEFWAPPSLVTPTRILLAWTIARLRHPILGAHIAYTVPLPSSSSSHSSHASNHPDARPTQEELERHYRSANYVLDPPESVVQALRESERTMDLEHVDAIRSEDMMWTYMNGLRSVGGARGKAGLMGGNGESEMEWEGMVRVGIKRSYLEDLGSSSDASSSSSTKEPRERYMLTIACAHCVIDGLATFQVGDDLFELLGGAAVSPSVYRSSSSSPEPHVPRTDAQLEALLRAEWALRYGAGSPLRSSLSPSTTSSPSTSSNESGPASSRTTYGFIPASFESRVLPLDVDADGGRSQSRLQKALADYNEDQARFEGGHGFFRSRPTPRTSPMHASHSAMASKEAAPLLRSVRELPSHSPILPPEVKPSMTSPTTPHRHVIAREVAYPPAQTARILRKCRSEGVTVQNTMFAIANVAWLRIVDRARRMGVRPNDESRKQMQIWADRCDGPTLMYTAVNLRPLVGQHEYGLNHTSKTGSKPSQMPKEVVPPSSAYVALGYFNVQLPGSVVTSPSASTRAQASTEFWSRAREAKAQTADAAFSPNLLDRNVLMAQERGDRSVRFAIEDDGWVGRMVPSPPSPPASSPAAPMKTPTPPAQALLGLSLLGSIDGMYKYASYPSITPTLARCGTRKTYGGILLFSYTFCGCLYVNLQWSEESFPEVDGDHGEDGVGIRAFWKEMRTVMKEFVFGDLTAEEGASLKDEEWEDGMGVDVTGTKRLAAWDESVTCASSQKGKLKNAVPANTRGASGGRQAVMQMAKL